MLRWWYHPESDSAFVEADESDDTPTWAATCNEITQAEFEQIKLRQASEADQHQWITAVENNGVHSFTGHRPDKVGGYSPNAQKRLISYAMEVLQQAQTEIALIGMALGWDQALADACVNLDIPFVAVVPFPGQEDRWPQPSRERYARLIAAAQDQITISPSRPVHGHQAAAWLDERNHWMVDNSTHLHALWNGDQVGGTANCVAYATLSGRDFTNHWAGWAKRGWLPEMFEELL